MSDQEEDSLECEPAELLNDFMLQDATLAAQVKEICGSEENRTSYVVFLFLNIF